MADDPRKAFEDAVTAQRVATRFASTDRTAKAFSTPEAMQAYMKAHPKANPAKHSVKQKTEKAPKTPKVPKTKAPPKTKAAPKSKAKPEPEVDQESEKGLSSLRDKWKNKKKPEAKPKEDEPKEGTFAHAKKKFNDSKAHHDKAKGEHEKAVAEHDEHHKTKSSDALTKGGQKGWSDWHDKSKALKKKVQDTDKARNSAEADMQNAHAHGVAMRDKEKGAKK